jgi:hypothetical protein
MMLMIPFIGGSEWEENLVRLNSFSEPETVLSGEET